MFGLFGQNLKQSQNAGGSTDTSSTVSMTLDILVLLLPFLSAPDASELFDAIFSEEVLVNPDNAVQKRGYKILARLVEGDKLTIDVEPNALHRIGYNYMRTYFLRSLLQLYMLYLC